VEAEAESVKGDDTSDLFDGLLTVTPAIAGMVMETASEEQRKRARVVFIGILGGLILAQSPSCSRKGAEPVLGCSWAGLSGKEFNRAGVELLSNLY
jgi:hypothetical protein